MKAKHRFKEGWIMLLRPFKFAELSKPLQKMTILYAYSEKPLITMTLDKEGKKELDLLTKHYGESSMTNFHTIYSKRHHEDEDFYYERMEKEQNRIFAKHATVEEYKGELLQCYVEKQTCKFYPEEYSIISRETFEYLLTSSEEEYQLEIENSSMYETKEMKDKLHYIRSRGINKKKAQKMASSSVKGAVIFRPQEIILQTFCREYEIFKCEGIKI